MSKYVACQSRCAGGCTPSRDRDRILVITVYGYFAKLSCAIAELEDVAIISGRLDLVPDALGSPSEHLLDRRGGLSVDPSIPYAVGT